jgi:peroxiredoxin
MDVMRRNVFLLPLVASAVALTGCNGHGAVKQDVAGTNGYQTGDLTLTYVSPDHRSHPGAVQGRLLSGQHFDLAAWKGKVVVVNWWSSDCAPCQAEGQALEQVYTDMKSRGVEFLGVDIRDNAASARRFAQSIGSTYPSLDDPDNLVALQFRHLPPAATPTTIVLDRSGRIAARENGEIYYRELTDLVDRVLTET